MKKLFIIVLVIFCITHHATAFDNKRSGFVIGGLGGIGLTIWNQSVNGFDTDTETDFSVHTDFRIGGGFNGDTSLLYFWNVVNWFSMVNVPGDDVVITSGVTALGFSYYFKPTAPSFYINAGLGISSWTAPFEEGAEYWWGFGLMGGVGYEFTRHWSMEFGFMWGNPSDEEMAITYNSADECCGRIAQHYWFSLLKVEGAICNHSQE